MHAEGARLIGARGYDSATPASNDERLTRQRRIVALLDGGIERVAVEVGDGEIVEFGMGDDARRAAAGTATLGLGRLPAP